MTIQDSIASPPGEGLAAGSADRRRRGAATRKTLPLLGGFKAESDLALCLIPLLSALGWRGDSRTVAEALPHFSDDLDLTDLRNVMAHLNYASRTMRLRLGEVDDRLLPCLFLVDHGPAYVLLSRSEKGLRAFNAETADYETVHRLEDPGELVVFSPAEDIEETALRPGQMRSWVRDSLIRFRPLFWQLFAMTLVLNIIALAAPLFVMAVYDRVLSTGSISTLEYLLLGVLIALVGDAMLRSVRARVIAYVGARLDHMSGNAVFQRLMMLPLTQTERAAIGAQIARLKDFDSVREFFTGPLAMVFLEMPFALLHISVIAYLGGSVALVPVAAVGLYALLAMVLIPLVREKVAAASRAESRRQEFLVEALAKMRAIKVTAAETVWRERYRTLAATAAMANYKSGTITAITGALSQGVVMTAGVATLAVGVVKVVDLSMSVGGLIASMMLVWRILAPLQTSFMALTQIEQIRASVRQIDGLMGMKLESPPHVARRGSRQYKGRITFSRVSLRYAADADPALVGVSFEVQPGEVVALVGPNGCGKSTALKLIGGLYQPQAGNVRIDGIDIRQLDPVQLRQSVAYVPQQVSLYFGTIAQNLRLAQPTASDEELREALRLANILDEVDALPEGLETRIGDGRSEALSASFAQGLSLARAYVKKAPIILFDEPVNGLDFDGDRAFLRAVETLRGHATVLIVTHRPSHLKQVDKIVMLDRGYVRMAGPRDQVLDKIPEGFL